VIKTILLDLDGPLLDGTLRHYQCYSDILESHGYSPMPIDRYWEMKRLRKTRKEQLDISGARSIYDLFLEQWLKYIEQTEYLALDRVQDGALSKLQEWVNGGTKVVLVTMRSNQEQLLRQLNNTGLLPFFDSVIVCEHANGGEGKASEVLGLFPEINPLECLWVGDTEADVEGARHLGCPVCLLTCGLRTMGYLTSLEPDFMAERLSDVNLEKMVKYVC